MDRVYEFLPSLIAITLIGGTARLLEWYWEKRSGADPNSIEYHQQRSIKTSVMDAFVCLIGGVALEEVVFRSPLIIAFSAMTSIAWWWLMVSSLLFGLYHWNSDLVTIVQVFQAHQEGRTESDDLKREADQLRENKGKRAVYLSKMARVVICTILGMGFGYFSIWVQSLWWVFGLHLVWNLVVIVFPILIVGLIIGVVFVVGFVRDIWHNLWWATQDRWGRWKWRWRRLKSRW